LVIKKKSWVEGLLLLGCRPLSAANQVSHSKISVSYQSLMVPWMEVDNEIYDRWLRTASNCGQQLLYLLYQNCFAKTLFSRSVAVIGQPLSNHPR